MKKQGAIFEAGGCTFTVWAPQHKEVMLHLVYPEEKHIPMQDGGEGYHKVTLPDVKPGTRYYYHIGGKDLPDPASRSQPEGVHQASEVTDHSSYAWTDAGWKGINQQDLVIYELHVGCFTPEGTFEAIIPRLKDLAETGITALQLMPVTQFPGTRNWGYDTAYLYSVQHSYGGARGLKALANACHAQGLALLLDVVYNHFSPEGNYLAAYGPYFTDKYTTPWGSAVNYDGEWSDGVKDFITGNLRYWLEEFHIDGLRLDAVYTIFDQNAVNIWELIRQEKEALQAATGRTYCLIAESDLNSPRTVQEPGLGGQGFDVQWLDDFHHALFVLLHPPGRSRYVDFGSLQQLAKAYNEGFVHSGEYVQFRKRRHGASSAGVSGDRFVAFNQNHDQVGNRPGGERLSVLVNDNRLRLAAAALLLAPYIPMLFMGEEYGEKAPFFYFVDHSDPALIAAVREGRENEFAAFKDQGTMPDAQDEGTFLRSKVNWELRTMGSHRALYQWHRQLLSLRRSHPVLRYFGRKETRAHPIADAGLALHRSTPDGQSQLFALFNFSEAPLPYTLPVLDDQWQLILHSGQDTLPAPVRELLAHRSSGSGAASVTIPALTAVVYERVH